MTSPSADGHEVGEVAGTAPARGGSNSGDDGTSAADGRFRADETDRTERSGHENR